MYDNLNGERVYLYIPLYKYKKEIHEKFSEESCFFLMNILLEYCCKNEYYTYETYSACESEEKVLNQLNNLEQLFKTNVSETPKYVLMLDGVNDILPPFQEYFAKELEHIDLEWRNVQIIVSGKKLPDYNVFKKLKRLDIYGIPDSKIDKILSALPESVYKIPRSSDLKRLLKNPLFFKAYLENYNEYTSIDTRGELLDYYIMQWEADLPDENMKMVLKFIVHYILPFVGKTTFKFSFSEISRTQIDKEIDKAFRTFLENKFVYQDYIAPKGFNKDILLEAKEKYNFIEIILENTGFMTVSEKRPKHLRFMNNDYEHYFAGKCIVNLLDILVNHLEKYIDEANKFATENELNFIWFCSDEEIIYKIIGEICGDHRNIDYLIKPNVVEDFLWLCKGEYFDTFRAVENIIDVMKYSRNGIIANVNFSSTTLPLEIPADIKFVDCNFTECNILLIEAFNKYIDFDNNCRVMKEAFPTEKLDNFKNCDFRGANYWLLPDYKDMLKMFGAIVD